MNIVEINISRLQKNNGYSLPEFSKHLNVSTSFIPQVDRGKTSVSITILKDIANALDTKIGSIIRLLLRQVFIFFALIVKFDFITLINTKHKGGKI